LSFAQQSESRTSPSGSRRLIVVGDAALADRLRPLHGDGVVTVPDYLHALGELGRHPADTLVGRYRPMEGALEQTARSLRQVAPGARLLLVVEAGDEPQAMKAVRLGFDDYLVEPVAAEELAEVLNLPLPEAGDEDAAAASTEPTPEREPPIDVRPTEELAAMMSDASPFSLTEQPRPSAESGDSGESAAASGAPASSAERELIERLLSGRGSLRDLLIDHLRRSLGREVNWAAEPDLDAAACLALSHGRQTFGYLVSDAASDHDLARAAEWAGRWMALERHLSDLKHLAMHDELTGAWNRRYFERFLESVVRRAREQRFRVTLLLFDIDNFKRYNDRYGHPAGDELLRETARLMQSVVRKHDVVARIGGDEFAVIFWDAEAPRKQRSEHPQSVRRAAERFREAVCQHRFPKLTDEVHGTLTISGGLASFPWDGSAAGDLIDAADQMLLQSKQQGKNAITLGPGALRACNGEED